MGLAEGEVWLPVRTCCNKTKEGRCRPVALGRSAALAAAAERRQPREAMRLGWIGKTHRHARLQRFGRWPRPSRRGFAELPRSLRRARKSARASSAPGSRRRVADRAHAPSVALGQRPEEHQDGPAVHQQVMDRQDEGI